MASTIKNILAIIALALALGFGYYLYMQNKGATLNTGGDGIPLDVTVESARFLQSLNELQNITLTNSVFLDSRFSAFTSYAGEVQSEPVGRSNPFESN